MQLWTRFYIILILLCLPTIGMNQERPVRNPELSNTGAFDPEASGLSLSGNSSTAHPLGLLPNPIIRKDTRYVYDDMIWRNLDTSLRRFHEYNLVDKWHYPHLYLGTGGHSYRSLVFDPDRKVGFHHGWDMHEKYFYKYNNIRYYNTKIPYTSLYYNLGAGTENNANAIHSQNFSPYYNAAVDYRLTNAQGAFDNQKTLMHNLTVNNWYNSKNHRTALAVAMLFNRLNLQENGGINFDLYTKANSGTDRSLVPVNLNQAINDYRKRGVYLKQYLFLGQKDSVQINDSTEIELVQRQHAISYAFHFDHMKHVYEDAQSDLTFYTGYYFDSTATNDSSKFFTTSHTFRFENTPESYVDSGRIVSPLRYFAAIDYDYTKYQNLDLSENWHTLKFSGGIASNPLREQKIHYGINMTAGLSKNAVGDFSLNAYLRWKINDIMRLTTFVDSRRTSPTQKERAFRSNHFVWSNDFDPVFNNKLSLLFRCDKGDIDGELTWHNVQNMIYYDDSKQPVQANRNLNVLVFTASKAFDWKNFYLYNGIIAQYISDREQLQLPKFFFKQSFYYQGGFFSDLLKAHLGFDIHYYTSYFADGYNPAVAEFHHQTRDELKFYPVVDVFFEIFIKQARLFFLMEHVNQGMFAQKGYYVAPDYGAQDRAFKLGVSWQFFD